MGHIPGEDGADPFVQYRSLSKKDWHDTAAYEADQKRTGAGEQGKPVIVSKDNATINKIRVSYTFCYNAKNACSKKIANLA